MRIAILRSAHQMLCQSAEEIQQPQFPPSTPAHSVSRATRPSSI